MSQALTVEALEELERLEKAAAAGPWRAGRSDTTSYTGGGLGPYKNVYGPRNEPELHLGHAIPLEEAQGWGDHCIENAQLIAAARNALPQLLESARRYLELKEALAFCCCFPGFDVLNESAPNEPAYCAVVDGHESSTKTDAGAAVVDLARELGWQGAKPCRCEGRPEALRVPARRSRFRSG